MDLLSSTQPLVSTHHALTPSPTHLMAISGMSAEPPSSRLFWTPPPRLRWTPLPRPWTPFPPPPASGPLPPSMSFYVYDTLVYFYIYDVYNWLNITVAKNLVRFMRFSHVLCVFFIFEVVCAIFEHFLCKCWKNLWNVG